MSESDNILVDEIVESVHHWSKLVSSSLCGETESDTWSNNPDSLNQLRAILKAKALREDVENVLRDALSGLAHSMLVTLDGGTKMADKIKVRLADQNGHYFCSYLHEIFADRMVKSIYDQKRKGQIGRAHV